MTTNNRWIETGLLMAGGLALATATATFAAQHVIAENDAIRDSQTAKISLSDAVNRTQAQFGGKAELENEEGSLAYEIELINDRDVREARLDAVTGIVLSNTADDSDDTEGAHASGDGLPH